MVQVLEVENWHFIDTVAETALVATAAIDELHVGAHVGLTSIAAYWARLAMVHDIQRSLIFGQLGKWFNNGS